MNRKNTILIAVLINAGLLAVLLIAALTTQEEVITPSTLIGDAVPKLEDKPLFGDAADLAMRQPLAVTPQNEIILPNFKELTPQGQIATPALTEAAAIPNANEVLVHKLPPLVPEAAPVAAAAPAAQPPFCEVVVKKGESLEKIAKAHHTSVDEIIKVNHLLNTFLRIGQVLKIPTEKSLASQPKPKPATVAKETFGPEYYTVKVGDNPWTIAMKHHIKVEELLRLNSLNEERARKLKPGDRLRTR
ncbi:MAG TPA: LysM peptidoglycan-binding domain-containing protein [Chlamydiales bacterium]|nr:LysM peptidoglycan-binding domain-containing protein [Chlamydiales bacterium]